MKIGRGAATAYVSLVLVMLLWAGNSIVGRAVHQDIAPFTLAFLRWTLAAALLLPFAARHIAHDRATLIRHWKPVLLLGIFGIAGFNGFLYSGLRYTNATNAMLLQAAIPAGVLLADRALFGQSAPMRQMVGIALSTAGVIVVVLRGDPRVFADMSLGRGDLLVMGAVAVWALYASLLRRKPDVHPLSLLSVTFVIGALGMAPLAAAEWLAGDRPIWGPAVISAILYVAIFPSIISYALYNRAVERVGPAKAGQANALLPVFGALIAAALLDEPLHAYHLAGMALILGGIIATIWADRRGRAAHRPFK
jgi:drug/metabolite transporter (DMT)-like permease